MVRPVGSGKALEARRRRALKLLDKGLSLHEVAEKVGCAASSVMRWRDKRDEEGDEGLKVRVSPGRPPRLTNRQRERLVKLLLKGPQAQGYSTDVWTTARVAELIKSTFDIRYHSDHVGRLLHALGWTVQRPQRRAVERDEEKIRMWKTERWPAVKKTPGGWVPISSS
jgi:transposase